MSLRNYVVSGFLLFLTCIWLAACQQAQPITVTRLVEAQVTKEIPVEVTRVVVEEKQIETTKIVLVTPTPTLIPTGGFLVAAMQDELSTLNPLLSSDATSRHLQSLIYGSMLRADPFTGEDICYFCREWTFLDGTITFSLRDDITWSDGEPVSADDFIYTYAALLWGYANESLDTPYSDIAANIQVLTKVDESTVAVTLYSADCNSLQDLNIGWLPQHRYSPDWQYTGPLTREGPFGDADDPKYAMIESSDMNIAPPISNGPFIFDEWVPGDHIAMVQNPAFFRGTPYLDGLVVRMIPDEEEQVRLLRSGELDLVEDFGPKFLTEIELLGTLQVDKVIADSYFYLGMQLGDPSNPQPRWREDAETGDLAINQSHGEHPILGDLFVRQAIAFGLDRRGIIGRVEVGQGIPLYSNMLPSLKWAFNADLEDFSYDPEHAGELLDQAGWMVNPATGIREKEGQSLSLDLVTNSSNEKRVEVAAQVKEQLEKIGFDIQYQSLEWSAFVGLLLGQQFDLVVVSWSNLKNQPDDSVFFSSRNDTPGLGFNFVSYFNTELDNAWQQALNVPGCQLQGRAEIYRNIQATLAEELPYNWLYAPLTLIGSTKSLKGIDPGPWGIWYNVEKWYLDR